MQTAKTTGMPQATNARSERRRGSRKRRRGSSRRLVTLYDGDTPIGTVECEPDEPVVGTNAPDVYLRRTSS